MIKKPVVMLKFDKKPNLFGVGDDILTVVRYIQYLHETINELVDTVNDLEEAMLILSKGRKNVTQSEIKS